MFTNETVEQVKQDINHWIINFVEATNEFYGRNFPVCPYARAARLAGESLVEVYQSGGVRNFIGERGRALMNDPVHTVTLLVFPPIVSHYPGIHQFILKFNRELIANDLFSLGGRAVGTHSSFPGLFNSGEYFVVGINTLSNVLPSSESLKSAGYYDNWSKKHYHDIVERRQEL